jgi:cobalamin biosynthesis protein CobT
MGTVVATQGKYMTVRFGCGDKSFVYPDSFERFLTLGDGTVSEEILADLQSARAAKQQIINKKHEENLRSMTHGIVIPGKEIVEGDEEEKEDKSSSEEI